MDNLKSKKPDLIFPPAYESKYANLSKSNKGSAGSKSNAEASSKVSKNNLKTKKNLDTVKDNLQLINSLIDEHDPSEDVTKNDTLVDLVSALSETEKQLLELI